MRMSDNSPMRLEGLGAVDPASVSGSVMVAGDRILYRNGILTYGGKVYAVSDDKDFVISSDHLPIGAIINGTLIALDQLDPGRREFFRKKYGY